MSAVSVICRGCEQSFGNRNALFRHLRDETNPCGKEYASRRREKQRGREERSEERRDRQSSRDRRKTAGDKRRKGQSVPEKQTKERSDDKPKQKPPGKKRPNYSSYLNALLNRRAAQSKQPAATARLAPQTADSKATINASIMLPNQTPS